MVLSRWDRVSHARVNPYAPIPVLLAGVALIATGYRDVGIGVAVGSVLAVVNSLLLSGRVEVAAESGDVAQALLVMQAGLFVTFVIVGVATVILVHFSVPLAVGSAIGFGIAQTLILMAFYWTRGRAEVAAGRQAS
jgi:hypothetical protein